MINWHGKPFYSLDAYFKNTYGSKCYKIAVDAGCTCPNRDGLLDTRGCIFCSAGGSGDFAVPIDKDILWDEHTTKEYIDSCIEKGIAKFNKPECDKYVIYFQAFTNTYGDITKLKAMWSAALSHPMVVGISIATRPDCLGEDVISALIDVRDNYKELNKFIWIELGLQTIHESTANYIRRHYSLSVFDEACDKLSAIDIPYIVHVIIGLPGETRDMMLQTIDYVNDKKPFGIKLQLLHVLRGTDMATDYENGKFEVLTMEEYIDIVYDCVKHLDEDIVIHRITGDGPKNILIAPLWSGNKKKVLNSLWARFRQ